MNLPLPRMQFHMRSLCRQCKKLIKGLQDYGPLDDDITILKLIDSFNDRFQLKAERIQNTSSNIDILQRGITVCSTNCL